MKRIILLSCLLLSTTSAIEKRSPESLKAYADLIQAQMKRMNESLEQSDKYATEELNPSLMKIMGEDKDEVLVVDSEADQDDSNMLATKSSLKTHMSKHMRKKLGEKKHKKYSKKHNEEDYF